MIFVLVHGIHDTCTKVKPLQTALEQQGHHCLAPSLTPNNGSKGLEHLAKQLRDFINAELPNQKIPIGLVGFSMGGLVSRYYLQELSGHQRVSHFFSIAAPHHGTIMAYFSTRLGAKQMRPNSLFLQNLQQSADCLQTLRCYSFWTPWDLMILPASSSVWDRAENIAINSLSHPLLLSSRRLHSAILARSI